MQNSGQVTTLVLGGTNPESSVAREEDLILLSGNEVVLRLRTRALHSVQRRQQRFRAPATILHHVNALSITSFATEENGLLDQSTLLLCSQIGA